MKVTLTQIRSLVVKDFRSFCLYGAWGWFNVSIARKIADGIEGDRRDVSDLLGVQSIMQEAEATMLGSPRSVPKVIFVHDAQSLTLKQVKEILAEEACQFFFVCSEYLMPSSSLRKFFEKAEDAAILPLYEPTEAQIQDYVEALLGARGMTVEKEAQSLLRMYAKYNPERLDNLLHVSQLYEGSRLSKQGLMVCLRSFSGVVDSERLLQAFLAKDGGLFARYVYNFNWEDVPQSLFFSQMLQEVMMLFLLLKKQLMTQMDPLMFKWKKSQAYVGRWAVPELQGVIRWAVRAEVLAKKSQMKNELYYLIGMLK